MKFVPVKDLRAKPKSIWEALAAGSEVVLTNNGKPTALMIDIPEDGFDETIQAIRQARAMIAFNNMRAKAATEGFMTAEEIDAEISAYRADRRADR
ncbi:MAG: type II toxin-antitoxin system Phd/YefM family antitoxin [Coriobacteriales bacterium]|jgi:antitoxin (DNA-binding transcriptional repressor) of toxin-antitoxin stability system|nr:type II toxin-antitoxin system Phd/YefM family antitoxin [Coriobacteriales bacterium]